MASILCLVRNVIVFFYGYVYEGYYKNNVDRCFTNLSGYADNTPYGLDFSCLIPRASSCLCPNGQPETTLLGCRG